MEPNKKLELLEMKLEYIIKLLENTIKEFK